MSWIRNDYMSCVCRSFVCVDYLPYSLRIWHQNWQLLNPYRPIRDHLSSDEISNKMRKNDILLNGNVIHVCVQMNFVKLLYMSRNSLVQGDLKGIRNMKQTHTRRHHAPTFSANTIRINM